MTKQYMLLKTQNRNFAEPLFFMTRNEAYQAMKEDLARSLGTDVKHIDSVNSIDIDFCLENECAWISDYGYDTYLDWQIFNLPDETMEET